MTTPRRLTHLTDEQRTVWVLNISESLGITLDEAASRVAEWERRPDIAAPAKLPS